MQLDEGANSDRLLATGESRGRTLTAFLVAPGATMVLFLLRGFVEGGSLVEISSLEQLGTAAIETVFFSILIYAALIPAIPVWWLFRWWRVRSFWLYSISAGWLGVVHMLLLWGILDMGPAEPESFLWFFLCGMASGAVFRAIYRPPE